MKHSSFLLILSLIVITVNAQTSYDLNTGVNQSTLEKVKQDNEERQRKLENLNVPKYVPPRQFKKTELIDNQNNQNTGKVELPQETKKENLTERLYSSDPAIQDAAMEEAKRKASQDPTSNGLGYESRIKYQPGQEEFDGAYYGFNPNLTVEENRKWYAKMGFTMSYKYSDKQIYTWIIISLLVLIGLGFIIFKWKKLGLNRPQSSNNENTGYFTSSTSSSSSWTNNERRDG